MAFFATCMACTCPCEIHQEHTHPMEDAVEEESEFTDGGIGNMCSACGHEHNADGTCDCGCGA